MGSGSRRATAAGLWLIGLLAVSALQARLSQPAAPPRFEQPYVDVGEALLTGAAPQPGVDLAFHMPLSGLADALLDRWRQAPGGARGLAFLLAAPAALAFALGGLGGSLPAAYAAGLLLALSGALRLGAGADVHYLYALMTAAAAGLLLWRERSPSLASSLAAGLAVGASLLQRSPLVFLPPLWAALEWRGARRPRSWTAALLLAPYLFLLPWIRFNHALGGGFTPLERGGADSNIAAGALGLVPNVEGDWRALAGGTPGAGGTGIYAWAAREVLRHPLRYGAGVAGRLAYAVRLQPLLFALAALALWLCRDLAEARALGLFCAYLGGIYCLMAVEPGYFSPLWIPLCALAGLGAGRLLRQGADEAVSACSLGLAAAAAAMLLALAALTAARLDVYRALAARRDPSGTPALEEALKLGPRPWLFHERGRRELSSGAAAEAQGDFEQALRSEPGNLQFKLEWCAARLFRGDAGEILRFSVPRDSSLNRWELLALQALARKRAGRDGEARSLLAEALRLDSGSVFVRRLEEEGEKLAQERLRRSRESLGLERLDRLIPWWIPYEAQIELLEAYLPLLAPSREPAFYEAVLLKNAALRDFGAGRVPAALAELRRSVALRPGLLSARLSLGAALSASGDDAAAMKAYDEALAFEGPVDDTELVSVIRDSRERLARRRR